MRKTILMVLVAVASFCSNADAQFVVKKKKKSDFQETEQEDNKPYEFNVGGFARDRDERKVRRKDPNQAQLNGFDNNAYTSRDYKEPEEEVTPKKGKKNKKGAEPATNSKKPNRDRDIESLMTSLVLAKIQRPVFRGIMTEHLRDVTTLMANETMDPTEKNVALRQLYNLRNKRLQEVLNDDQYRTWIRIKDEDEYIDIPMPEDV
jgi:hypothetical protein